MTTESLAKIFGGTVVYDTRILFIVVYDTLILLENLVLMVRVGKHLGRLGAVTFIMVFFIANICLLLNILQFALIDELL